MSSSAAISSAFVAHLGPVFDGRAYVPEHAADALDQLLTRFVVDGVDLDGDPGLHVGGVVALGNQVRTGSAWLQCRRWKLPMWTGTRVHLHQLRGFPVAGDHKERVQDQVDGAFCRTSSALTESTRKGISSVTM